MMWKTNWLFTGWLVVLSGMGSVFVHAQPTDNRKLEMAHQWGTEKYQKELAQVEEAYAAEIRAAQAKRAEGIKMARVRYLQGLKFLNLNPSLPQAMRVRINEEMKRVTALPDPVAPEVKAPDSKVPQQTAKRTIQIKLDTPDTGWSVSILQIKKVNDQLWVLSGLRHGSDIVQFVITPVEDSVIVEAAQDLPVRHFVLNKTWEWKNKEDIRFIRGVPELGRDWALGKIVPLRRQ